MDEPDRWFGSPRIGVMAIGRNTIAPSSNNDRGRASDV
jgi:hypothetical protein